MTLYNRVGELIFGTRLKRLSDRFLADVAQLYKALNIAFEPSWFPIFWLLDEAGTLSVTEIATELEVTHSAISQMVGTLDKRGLLCFQADAADRRRRLVCLTPAGQEMVTEVRPVWRAMTRAMRDLLEEGSHSTDLLSGLDELELALGRKSFIQRLLGEIKKDDLGPVQVMPALPGDDAAVQDLLLLWLTENPDLAMQAASSESDGLSLIAKVDGEPIGLLRLDNDTITHLVVQPEWRHRHVGRQLVESALVHAKEQQLTRLSVLVPRRAVHALKLFRDLNFRLVTVTDGASGQDIHLIHTLYEEDAG